MIVHGSEYSYYTGKLEAYLRWKGLAYRRVPMTAHDFERRVPRATGAAQMPAVELPDGRWMTDTTPIIEWLERVHPEFAVVPQDPLQAFASRLLEDYADEWLWRPAMHYRWSYHADAELRSRGLAEEMLAGIVAPPPLKRWLMRRRQFGRFVRGDGVTGATRQHVEGVYLRTLAALETIVVARPYLLGEVPTLADFGFFGSMFRHFALDPTPGAIMRERAPAVHAWVARLWNARAEHGGDLLDDVPGDWAPLLDDVGSAYLPYLCANADAHAAGRRRFDVTVQDTTYRRVPVSRYRVWCLERLRQHYEALGDGDRVATRALLERHGCWEPLWRVRAPRSGYDPEGRAPFGPGLGVFAR